jgi:hypothetical protein
MGPPYSIEIKIKDLPYVVAPLFTQLFNGNFSPPLTHQILPFDAYVKSVAN